MGRRREEIKKKTKNNHTRWRGRKVECQGKQRRKMKYGGIELGGTKIVYGIGDESGLLERHSVPTSNPASTLTKIQEYFREKKIEKLGIATFGPVDLLTGTITTTPKLGWSGVNLKNWFEEWDVAIDTDVNGACLGEVAYGAGRGKQSVVYGTIGTGIGFGVYKEKKHWLWD